MILEQNSVHALTTLLRRAESGDLVCETEYMTLHQDEDLNSFSSDAVLHNAVHFLQHYMTDADLLVKDEDYREVMMEKASEHLMKIAEKFEVGL